MGKAFSQYKDPFFNLMLTCLSLCWVFTAACGLSLVAVNRLLTVVAALISECRL